jgi:alginate O-acetyltransferase complex protein AlgI
LEQAGQFFKAMLVPTEMTHIAPDLALLLTDHRIVLLAVLLITALLPGTWVTGKVIDGLVDVNHRIRALVRATAYALTPYAGVVAVAGTFSPFLYFQF